MSSKAVVHINIFERIIWGQKAASAAYDLYRNSKGPQRIVCPYKVCFESYSSSLPYTVKIRPPYPHRLYCSSLSGLPTVLLVSLPHLAWTSPLPRSDWVTPCLHLFTACSLFGWNPSFLVGLCGFSQQPCRSVCSLRKEKPLSRGYLLFCSGLLYPVALSSSSVLMLEWWDLLQGYCGLCQPHSVSSPPSIIAPLDWSFPSTPHMLRSEPHAFPVLLFHPQEGFAATFP